MTERIKQALVQLAQQIVSTPERISDLNLHDHVQKLYELSLVYRYLKNQKYEDITSWNRQEKQLETLLGQLSVSSEVHKVPKHSRGTTDEMEVPTGMDRIKNLVTEIPEQKVDQVNFTDYETVPSFEVKDEVVKPEEPQKEKTTSQKKNVNDQFTKGLHIDLNDRLAFVKNLFGNSTKDYQRVLSQITTFETFKEAKGFITEVIKPEYGNWKGKVIFETRFYTILTQYFKSKS